MGVFRPGRLVECRPGRSTFSGPSQPRERPQATMSLRITLPGATGGPAHHAAVPADQGQLVLVKLVACRNPFPFARVSCLTLPTHSHETLTAPTDTPYGRRDAIPNPGAYGAGTGRSSTPPNCAWKTPPFSFRTNHSCVLGRKTAI